MKVELRADSVVIEGYVNAVGRDSRVIPSPLGPFVEQVEPKTFERALARGKNVELKLNHQRVVGSTAEGNLRLHEDNIGLYARAEVSDPEVIERARNHELRGWSFAFAQPKDRFEDGPNGIKRRRLEDLELREVSIIDRRKVPVYIGTSIEARDEDEAMVEQRGADDAVDTVDNTPPEMHDYGNLKRKIEIMRMRGTKA